MGLSGGSHVGGQLNACQPIFPYYSMENVKTATRKIPQPFIQITSNLVGKHNMPF